MRYTSTTAAMPVSPRATPTTWRRAIDATSPMIASPVTRTSSGCGRSKNMSQNESWAPDGRKPYFMSVMY